MTLERTRWFDDDPAPGLQNLARLAGFELEVDYELSGVQTQIRLLMHGDANGMIEWARAGALKVRALAA
jgi:hypothetical protein